MNRRLVHLGLLGLLLCWPAGRLGAGEPAAPVKPPESRRARPGSIPNRYLFLIEASSSMSRNRAVVQQTVRNLILGGVNGTMRPGDQIRIYTFNEKVESEKFPMQVWSLSSARPLAETAATNLMKLDYTKRSRLDLAIAEMITAVRASEDLIVFMFTDGKERIQGTAFDDEINRLFAEHSAAVRKAKTVFVTAFAARRGKILSWAMSAAGPGIQVPRLPELEPEPVASATLARTNATVVTSTPATKTADPTNAAVAVPTAATPPAEEKPPAAALVKPAVVPDPPTVEPVRPEPPPPSVTKAAVQPVPAPTTTNLHRPLPPSSIQVEPAEPIRVPTPVPPVVIPQPVPVSSDPVPRATQAVAAPARAPAATDAKAAPSPATPDIAGAPTPAAVVTPGASGSSRGPLWWLLGGATAILGIGFLAWRRIRAGERPSLITQSMNRRD